MLCELLSCGNKSVSCEEVKAEESAREEQRWLEVVSTVVLAAQAGESLWEGSSGGSCNSKKVPLLGPWPAEKGCEMRQVNWIGMGHTGPQSGSEKLRLM